MLLVYFSFEKLKHFTKMKIRATQTHTSFQRILRKKKLFAFSTTILIQLKSVLPAQDVKISPP